MYYYDLMVLAQSKITSQGQISIPASVRRELGLGPGSVIEWENENGQIVVRRAGSSTSADIRRKLFPDPPEPRSLEDLKEGIVLHIREKHARD